MEGTEREFTVEFTYTDEELQAFRTIREHFLKASAPQMSLLPDAAMAMAVALIGATIAVLLGITTERQGGIVAILLLAAYATGACSMYRRSWRIYRDQGASRQHQAAHEAQRCRLREAGVAQHVGQSEATCGWEAFDAIWSEAGLLLLMTHDGRGFPIPNRAFASPGEAAAALSFAQERLAAARAA